MLASFFSVCFFCCEASLWLLPNFASKNFLDFFLPKSNFHFHFYIYDHRASLVMNTLANLLLFIHHPPNHPQKSPYNFFLLFFFLFLFPQKKNWMEKKENFPFFFQHFFFVFLYFHSSSIPEGMRLKVGGG